MSDPRVCLLSPEQWPLWDSFVDEHPHGTVFQTTKWLRKLLGHLSVLALKEEESGRILGGLALLRNRRFGVAGYHPPALTPYLGPLIAAPSSDKEDVRRSTYQQGVQLLLGAVPKIGHVDFLLNPEQNNVLPYLWNGYSVELGYTSYIQGNTDAFHQSMSYGHRKRLKRLQRMEEAGHVQVVELSESAELIPILEATMRTKRFRYDLDAIGRLFTRESNQVQWKAVKVVAEGEAMACALSAFDNRSFYSLVGGVSRTGNSDLANSHLLCFDYMIRQALASGRRFDFCGSSLPGVDHFNRRFGGQLMPRLRVQKSGSILMRLLRAGKMWRHEELPLVVVE